jgi:hypothetical protein
MHFSVMIFGDEVEQQLAPFQETNMGPIAPAFMQTIDWTDEVHELFQARQQCFRLSDGRYVKYSQAHHRDVSGKMVLIHGAVATQLSADEARCHGVGYATLDDAAEDLGAERENDRFFIQGNPNSQWDSWVIGGRWGSMLMLLPGRHGYTATPLKFDPEFAKFFNRPPPEIWQPAPGYCDQAQKKDIDWVGMAAAAGEKAGAEWDLVNSWTKGIYWSTWAEVRDKFHHDVAREHYESQPAIKAIREGQRTASSEQWRSLVDDALLSGTREDYVAAAEERAGVPNAVVLDGQWLDSDTRDQEIDAEWNKQFHAILEQIADETMVTIVDCHD